MLTYIPHPRIGMADFFLDIVAVAEDWMIPYANGQRASLAHHPQPHTGPQFSAS